MDIRDLRKNWDALGAADPLFWVLTEAGKEGGKWDEAEFFKTGEVEVERLFAYIASLGLAPRADGKALDFGCGVGRLTQPLARRLARAVGVDISVPMIERANGYNKQPDRCEFVLNREAHLHQLADASFDLIYSNITLQHMSPRLSRGYIREFFRLLAPGGILVFYLPSHRRAAAMRLKDFAKSRLPGVVKRAFYRATRGDVPVMEMYGARLGSIAALVDRAAVSLVDARLDGSAGPDWVGYRYCIVKDR